MTRRIYTCSVCHKPGHDRRAHFRSHALVAGRRSISLGKLTLTVELRGHIADLTPDDRALVFAIADLLRERADASDLPVPVRDEPAEVSGEVG